MLLDPFIEGSSGNLFSNLKNQMETQNNPKKQKRMIGSL